MVVPVVQVMYDDIKDVQEAQLCQSMMDYSKVLSDKMKHKFQMIKMELDVFMCLEIRSWQKCFRKKMSLQLCAAVNLCSFSCTLIE